MLTRWGLFPLFVLGSACTTIPTGPSVLVLPGTGKPFQIFQADDAVCGAWAAQQTGAQPKDAGAQSTATGATLGTLGGAAVGAAIGAASGSAGAGAAIGAGAGLLGGTAVGASAGQTAGGAIQRRYDIAYQQCMYAKGHQIPGPARTARPAYVAPPPPVPPPPPPPPSAAPTPAPPTTPPR